MIEKSTPTETPASASAAAASSVKTSEGQEAMADKKATDGQASLMMVR